MRRRRSISIALTLLALVAGLEAAGAFLVVREPLLPVDVVIAISGDGTGERARTAAALVQRGFAPAVILSGSAGGRAPGGATAAMRREVLAAGVPPERVFVEEESGSTLDNAVNSARLMEEHGFRSAILVTSPYHTRRALWLFESELAPRGLDVRAYAAENSFFQPRLWWTRPRGWSLVVSEYRKLPNAYLRCRKVRQTSR